MRILITVALALTSISAAAQTSIKTSLIEHWGYSQDHLLLVTKSGKAIKVSPKLCVLSQFNKILSSGEGLNLNIPAKRVRQNTTFYVEQSSDIGDSVLKCQVGSFEA